MGAATNIQTIQELFQEVRQQANSKNYKTFLAKYSGDYLSVAYEAAAAAIANEDLIKHDKNFSLWKLFCSEFCNLHGSQIHVGLGWALAELNITDLGFINTFEPQWKWRVVDGFAYYSGLFKRRDTIRNQQKPDFFKSEDSHAFDQGLGRSLWYLSNGDTDRLMGFLVLFSESRLSDLWRGIGLASTYVGGLNSALINTLVILSGENSPSYKCGALLAIKARQISELPTSDTRLIQSVLGLSDPILSKGWPASKKEPYYSLLMEIQSNL